MYYVYIVECSDKTYYSGIARDVTKRIYAHNYGKTAAKYTRVRRPVVLKYAEKHLSRSAALKREYELKQLPRAQKELLWK